MARAALAVALPNKGRLHSETIAFLDSCALPVKRDNERQYESTMGGIPGDVEVVFQRARDIPKAVGHGQVDLGITGLDVFMEAGGTATRCLTVFPDDLDTANRRIEALPYGKCSLVLGVPDHWVDIVSVSDLAELAIVRRREGRMLRVATEFPNLTKRYLFNKSVSYFEIVEVYGAAESTPRMGSADLVADLRSSGVTLAENRLKEVHGGEILESSACVIASGALRREPPESTKLALARQFIDRVEAYQNGRRYWLITANIGFDGRDLEGFADALQEGLSAEETALLGQQGPTVAPVVKLGDRRPGDGALWSVSVQVASDDLERAVAVLRRKTGRDILVTPLAFVYDNSAKAYESLAKRLRSRKRPPA